MSYWRVALVTVTAMAGTLALLGATAVWALAGAGWGCADNDEDLKAALAGLAIVDARPPGAVPRGGLYTDCDDDDRFTSAGRSYAASAPDRDVDAFYRRAAAADGWRPSASGLCYEKHVAGVTAYLSTYFPAEPDAGAPDGFSVEVTASLYGDRGC